MSSSLNTNTSPYPTYSSPPTYSAPPPYTASYTAPYTSPYPAPYTFDELVFAAGKMDFRQLQSNLAAQFAGTFLTDNMIHLNS